MQTSHSSYENIKPGDVFFSQHLSPDKKRIESHYFVCIYSQKTDQRTNLGNDVIGVFLTTNPKYKYIHDEYVVEVKLYKKSYACVDKQFRFSEDKVKRVSQVSEKELDMINYKMVKFAREMERQMDDTKGISRKK